MFSEALERLKIIADGLDENDPDKLEMLNLEGDYSDLMDWAIEKRNEYVAQEEALKELIEKYTKRKKMLAQRADSMKDVMKMIMDNAGERSYKGAAGTVSIKATPPKVVVIDEEKIPSSYFDTKKVLNKTRLKEALMFTGASTVSIEGAEMSNGGETISVRV